MRVEIEIAFFLKDFTYSFLERDEERQKERERNRLVIGCLPQVTTRDLAQNC